MADAERARLAARVRAAIAYSGLQAEVIAEQIPGEFGVATLRRIASNTNPRGASLSELWAIADVCGVPRNWLEKGWGEDEISPRAGLLGKGTPEQRLEIVERYLEAIISQNGTPVVAGTQRKKSGRARQAPASPA